MPQRSDKLRVVLSELERELAATDEVDDDLRQRLEAVRGEITAALTALEASESPADLQPHSFIERLTAAEQEFEGAHPTLAGVLRRLIDGLAQLGI